MPRVEPTTHAGAAVCRAGEPGEQLWLFDCGGVDLELLRRERAAMSERRRSLNTRAAYASDWRNFSAWCASAGRSALPASADTLGLYLVSQARAGRMASTIGRRVASIVSQHTAAGLASPAPDGGDVREVLAGIRRAVGTAPRRAKAALTVDELRRLLAVCGVGRRGLRDRALLLVGFASGLRRSELAALDLADVDVVSAGLVIKLGRSKTDQSGAGRELGVHRGRHAATCPVRALLAWLVERGCQWPGPLFPRLDRGDVMRGRMSGRAVAAVVQVAAGRAGLDAGRYGGHSLRAGCATAAAAGGASDVAIMGRTGHRSVAMVARYVRHGTLFATDPLAGAL